MIGIGSTIARLPRVVRGLAIAHAIVMMALVAASSTAAQGFPDHTIRIVVGFPAGGASDTTARLLAQKMQEDLKQPVVVENRPGGASIIGTQAVATAPKDGYTLLFAVASSLVTNPHLYNNLPYRLSDFASVGMVTSVPFILAVRKDAPAGNVTEFVRWAKSDPKGLSSGNTGMGGTPHLASELMSQAIGAKLLNVAYKGATPAYGDMMGGTLDLMVEGMAALPLAKAGKIKIIANLSAKRSPLLPDVETFAEAGHPDVVISTWFSLMAPAGTPEPVIKRLAAAVKFAVNDPAFREKVAAQGQEVIESTPESTTTYIAKDYDRWGALIRKLDIKLE